MRLIVNNKQYNKILRFQKEKNKLYEGIVNIIYDNILLYEKHVITETNIRKTNIDKLLNNTTFNNITLDILRGELIEISSKKIDDILEIEATIPPYLNHTEIRNKIHLEVIKNNLLKEQQDKYGLNMDDLPLGDVIAINYLVDRIRTSLEYTKSQIIDKLLFIDGNNTMKDDRVLNIDVSKFNDVELNTIIEELEKLDNTNYVLDVDKNGEEVTGITVDFDPAIELTNLHSFDHEEVGGGNEKVNSIINDTATYIKPSTKFGSGRDYGWRDKISSLCKNNNRYCDWHWHGGEDYPYSVGTEIYVLKPGEVEKIGTHTLTIKHNDGSKTKYAHLNNIFVDQQNPIEAGTLIGEVGNKGASTGPHLHFEYYPPNAKYEERKLTKKSHKTNKLKTFSIKTKSRDPKDIEDNYIRFKKP